MPYHRPRLPEVIMDPTSIYKVFLHDQAWYEERRIDLRLNTSVKRVDTEAQKVLLEEDGTDIGYDKLSGDSGAASFPIPVMSSRVFTLWTR